MAPQPEVSAASLKKFSLSELYQVSSRKKDLPLKLAKKVCQTPKSDLTSYFRQTKCWGHWSSRVRSMNLRKKAIPGTTTAQAKLCMPIKEWLSFKVTFLHIRGWDIVLKHLHTLSSGNRASKGIESNSMLAKESGNAKIGTKVQE